MRLVHSYSALKLYEQCGLRYYRQRILKDVHEQETVYTTHGNNVHSAIENNIKHATPLVKELSAYSGVIKAVKIGAATSSANVVVEQNIGLTRSYNPTGYWDGDVWIRAKIDVLVTGSPDKTASIIDWKTGKRKVDYTQLKIAAISVFQSIPQARLENIKAAFVWLKDKVMDQVVYSRGNIRPMIEELTPRFMAIEEAQENNIWKPKPSYLCAYCPCRPTCSYAVK